jgi:tetratricopeptide (TPR) repeat protein
MTTRVRMVSTLAVVLGISLAAGGCGRYSLNALKAQKAWKDGNAAYTAQDYAKASEKYEYVLQMDPSRTEAHFYLANSYDNRFRPTRLGEPDNDALMQKAVEQYRLAAERAPDPQIKKLALQYLVAAYGAEKLNDPSQAEPIVQQMIQLEPNEPSNYFALANIYEEAGRYEDAEEAYLRARELRPEDPVVHSTLAGFYNRQGDHPKMLGALTEAANVQPDNPEGYYRLSVYYEEIVRKDHRLPRATKLDYSLKGIEAADKALAINPMYSEAMVYKNILMRHQATVETDRTKQQQLIKEADVLLERATEINKKRATGQGVGGN